MTKKKIGRLTLFGIGVVSGLVGGVVIGGVATTIVLLVGATKDPEGLIDILEDIRDSKVDVIANEPLTEEGLQLVKDALEGLKAKIKEEENGKIQTAEATGKVHSSNEEHSDGR
jgi:hypothetical protein